MILDINKKIILEEAFFSPTVKGALIGTGLGVLGTHYGVDALARENADPQNIEMAKLAGSRITGTIGAGLGAAAGYGYQKYHTDPKDIKKNTELAGDNVISSILGAGAGAMTGAGVSIANNGDVTPFELGLSALVGASVPKIVGGLAQKTNPKYK
jgi:hypothetical protein